MNNLQLALTAQNGAPWEDQSWKVFSVIVITWTAILICITLAMYQAEDCESKWRHVKSGLERALAEVQVLKRQNEELTSVLKEVTRLQLLDLKDRAKSRDKADFLEKLLLKVPPKESGDRDVPKDFLRLKIRFI